MSGVDATGRSTSKRTGRARKLHGPPKGEAWIWLTKDLLASPAWRGMGANARRLIDFLLVEHANHAGTENGNLIATHAQLIEAGLSGRLVTEAVSECAYFGLIRVQKGGWGTKQKMPSRFLLTFYADKNDGPATNEWKATTKDKVSDWKAGRARMRKAGVRPGEAAGSG